MSGVRRCDQVVKKIHLQLCISVCPLRDRNDVFGLARAQTLGVTNPFGAAKAGLKVSWPQFKPLCYHPLAGACTMANTGRRHTL